MQLYSAALETQPYKGQMNNSTVQVNNTSYEWYIVSTSV